MLYTNTVEDVVLALADAPIDARTGNRVLYSVNWIADRDSMIGQVNADWVRRELDWFNSGSDKLEDMEGPVPKLFQACAGDDGKVNSAYGHILFAPRVYNSQTNTIESLYSRVLDAFTEQGLGTRHAVAIISDRDVHVLAHKNGRNDFICTNALNFMVDEDNRLHIIAQMRSMDAVFGYRADYSMWDEVMNRLLDALNLVYPEVTRGNITFQVANLHVYPRHFELLEDTALGMDEAMQRRVWLDRGQTFSERMGYRNADGTATDKGRAAGVSDRMKKPNNAPDPAGTGTADVVPGSEEDLIRRGL